MESKEKMVSLYALSKKYCGEKKPIYWIRSYPTLRKWALKDYNTNNYFGMVIVPSEKGKGRTSVRYLIPVSNIDKFVQALQKGTLYAKEKQR